jgi:hypothetical protein
VDVVAEMNIKTELRPDGYWSAIDADNYEAESDSEGWWSKSPVGYGKTEEEAIEDLIFVMGESA